LITAFTMVHHLETESFSQALKYVLKPDGMIFFSWEPYFWSGLLEKLRYSKFGLRVFPERRDTEFERSLISHDMDAFAFNFNIENEGEDKVYTRTKR